MTAHNVLVLAAPALTVLAVGLLAREVTGDERPRSACDDPSPGWPGREYSC